MCSLKFGGTENKKPKKMRTLEMMYDGCWIVLIVSGGSTSKTLFDL